MADSNVGMHSSSTSYSTSTQPTPAAAAGSQQSGYKSTLHIVARGQRCIRIDEADLRKWSQQLARKELRLVKIDGDNITRKYVHQWVERHNPVQLEGAGVQASTSFTSGSSSSSTGATACAHSNSGNHVVYITTKSKGDMDERCLHSEFDLLSFVCEFVRSRGHRID